jgi:hypothetical protein
MIAMHPGMKVTCVRAAGTPDLVQDATYTLEWVGVVDQRCHDWYHRLWGARSYYRLGLPIVQLSEVHARTGSDGKKVSIAFAQILSGSLAAGGFDPTRFAPKYGRRVEQIVRRALRVRVIKIKESEDAG